MRKRSLIAVYNTDQNLESSTSIDDGDERAKSSAISQGSLIEGLTLEQSRDHSPALEQTDEESGDESSSGSPVIYPSSPTASSAYIHAPSLPYPKLPRQLWLLVLSVIGQVYISFFDMALGISKWWNSDGAEETEEELKPLGKGMRNGENVKRRRRKVDSPGAQTRSVKGYFPGMVNLSGTLCYMNSVLQSLASVPSMVDHLEKIIKLAVEVDMPTNVTDALLDVIRELNTPHKRPPSALRPKDLLQALYPLPAVRRLLGTHEQQDAHELFLVLAEAVSDEVVKVAAEVVKVRGLGELLPIQGYVAGKNDAKEGTVTKGDVEGAKKREKVRGVLQPWEGLLARRRVCQQCGWSEAVRMDTLSGMELSIPLHGDTTLDACITTYLAPEVLTDVTCEMCSLQTTLSHYSKKVERLLNVPEAKANGKPLSSPSASFSVLGDTSTNAQMTVSSKKRARDARRAENRLREMLESGTVSEFGQTAITPLASSGSTARIPVKWHTVRTTSFRQGIVTRPPQSLRLHMIRSEFTMYGTVQKKVARVHFPMILDFTRFVANGIMEERGGVRNMLAAAAEGSAPTPPEKRVLYRLESAICHYGFSHSSGHFTCIRRKPEPPSQTSDDDEGEPQPFRPEKVSKSCPDGCHCEDCALFGPIRDQKTSASGKGWLRISDADVEEVGEDALTQAAGAVVMLIYEKVDEYTGNKLPVQAMMTKYHKVNGAVQESSIDADSNDDVLV